MKTKIWLLFIVFSLNINAQDKHKLTFEKLNSDLSSYLHDKGDMNSSQLKKYKEGKLNIAINGVHNNVSKGEVINGIYAFSLNGTMARGYFLIVDNNEYTILDITTRDELDRSIKLLLDFCDKYNYCETIITDYVGRLTRVYYNLNKWKGQRTDLNCEESRGVIDTRGLP